MAPYLNDIPEWSKTMTEKEIRERLGLASTTFERYKREHSELIGALRLGRARLCHELKLTLKRKAQGYEYTETKTTRRRVGDKTEVTVETYTRYAQPDTGAIHLLLKNYDPDWRNDDATTAALKREQVEIAKQKAEAAEYA